MLIQYKFFLKINVNIKTILLKNFSKLVSQADYNVFVCNKNFKIDNLNLYLKFLKLEDKINTITLN